MARRYNSSGSRTSRRIDWSQFDHLLGQKPDQELAALIGCTATGVKNRRDLLGIAPKFKTHWSAEEESEFYVLRAESKQRCTRCKVVQPLSAFHQNISNNKNGREGYNRWCKECRSRYQSERIEAKRTHWIDLAGGACQHCGWNLYSVCLEFHHVNGDDKEWSPGKLIMSRPIDSEDVRSELDKCALLCANCHQAIHRGALRLEFQKRPGLGWTVRASCEPTSI